MSSAPDAPPGSARCQNCGAPLAGAYCAQCGQHDFDFTRSFAHVLHDVLEDLFHFDTKLFHGLYDLLFRPGFLSREFIAGRRAWHIPPLRFYVFVSVVFFLVAMSTPPRIEIGGPAHATGNAAVQTAPSQVRLRVEPIGHAQNSSMRARLQDAKANPAALAAEFTHLLPKMMILCLPAFALLTWLIFRRARLPYLAHLIIALHLHTFAYLWWLVADGWLALVRFGSAPVAGWLLNAAQLYALVYFYCTLRRVFGETRLRTLGKGVLLGAAYTAVLIAGISVAFQCALLFT